MTAEILQFRSAQNTTKTSSAPSELTSKKPKGLIFEWVKTLQDDLCLLNKEIVLPPVTSLIHDYGPDHQIPEIKKLSQWERVFLIFEMAKTSHDYWIKTHNFTNESDKYRFMPFVLTGAEEFQLNLEANLFDLLEGIGLVSDPSDLEAAENYFLLQRNIFCEEHGLRGIKDLQDFIRHGAYRHVPMSSQDAKILEHSGLTARLIAEQLVRANPGKFVL